MNDVTKLISQMIMGLASGTDEGKAAAETAGKEVILLKSAEALNNIQQSQSQPQSTETI